MEINTVEKISQLNFALLLCLLALMLACGVQKEPIHLAARQGDLTAIKRIIASGVDVNERDSAGDTALRYAILNDNWEVAKYLVSQGGTIDYELRNGISARESLAQDIPTKKWIDENMPKAKVSK